MNKFKIKATVVERQLDKLSDKLNVMLDKALSIDTDTDTSRLSNLTGVSSAEYGLSFTSQSPIGTISDRPHLRDFTGVSYQPWSTNGAQLNGGDDFIWNGTYTSGTPDVVSISAVTAAEYDSGLFLSKFHPLIANPTSAADAMSVNDIVSTGTVSMPKYAVKRSKEAKYLDPGLTFK